MPAHAGLPSARAQNMARISLTLANIVQGETEKERAISIATTHEGRLGCRPEHVDTFSLEINAGIFRRAPEDLQEAFIAGWGGFPLDRHKGRSSMACRRARAPVSTAFCRLAALEQGMREFRDDLPAGRAGGAGGNSALRHSMTEDTSAMSAVERGTLAEKVRGRLPRNGISSPPSASDSAIIRRTASARYRPTMATSSSSISPQSHFRHRDSGLQPLAVRRPATHLRVIVIVIHGLDRERQRRPASHTAESQILLPPRPSAGEVGAARIAARRGRKEPYPCCLIRHLPGG